MIARDWIVSQPSSAKQWLAYYEFRWQELRKPWSQERGTEKDNLESVSIHRMALLDGKVIGVGRIHLFEQGVAQVRYMAVDVAYQNRGVGADIIKSLEKSCTELEAQHSVPIKKTFLHSRESAVGFYERQGYTVQRKSHLLYGKVQHYLMHKLIATVP